MKEHNEFASNIDLKSTAAATGLYEAVNDAEGPDDASGDLVGGDYLVRFETKELSTDSALWA